MLVVRHLVSLDPKGQLQNIEKCSWTFPRLRAASLVTWLWSFPNSPWTELIDPLNLSLPTWRGQWDINSSKLGRSSEGFARWAVPSWHFKSLPSLTRTSGPAKLASEWKTHGWVMPTAPADTEPTARPKGSHSIKKTAPARLPSDFRDQLGVPSTRSTIWSTTEFWEIIKSLRFKTESFMWCTVLSSPLSEQTWAEKITKSVKCSLYEHIHLSSDFQHPI